ncbi:MAG: FG-GAP-like repeat-containing protein [candidate division Zixibacteria bacterium]|nr:FG-GAP-like repeat-containing protein [candidate division Zixibacteria bacterium]
MPEGFKSQVSQKNLLGLERTSKFALPTLKTISEYYAPVETLNVLAIRVEFQKEVPDDPKTTGDGLFDRRTYQEHYAQDGNIIDPSPHYRGYFLAHLKALNNYWNTVSNGKLVLKYEVYPLEESLTYQLPHTISYYGDTGLPDYPFDGLKRFFDDSFGLADSVSPEIDFSKYNCFVIFHAGSDKQSDLGSFVSTYTPNDLFTGFIVTGDTVKVDNGTYGVTEGMIMPETRSQDTRIGALNAVMAHEFGHQLGLPDFYNTRTFTTQIGDFSLMDNNAMDVGIELDSCNSPVSGLMPVYPDAWGKAFLGFTNPVEITNQSNVQLNASEILSDGALQTVKIPINSQEYFLVENRQIDIDGEPSYLFADRSTGVILGPVRLQDTLKVANREYDYLLPGSGILIWHIDEGVAYLDVDNNGFNNFDDNKLQWDKDRRFITLEEADGFIDFGGNYYTGYGSQEDMYYLGNNSNFTPYSFPSSRSNDRSETHIYVTNIGPIRTVMSFNVKNDISLAGWPQRIISSSGNSSLVYGDLDGNGKEEVLTASGKYIFAWKTDGSKFIPNSDVIAILGLDGKYTYEPLAIFAEADITIFGTPSLGDLDGDGKLEVVAGTLSGNLYIWHATDLDSDGRADYFMRIQVGNKISMTPVIADLNSGVLGPEVFAGAEDGKWMMLSFADSVIFISNGDYHESVNGLTTTYIDSVGLVLTDNNQRGCLRRTDDSSCIAQISSTGNFPPVVGDLNRDNKLEVVVLSGDGKIYAWDLAGHLLSGFPVLVGDIKSAPVLGDIDGDGYLEIIFCGDNEIYAYNYNGIISTNFPVVLDRAGTVGPIYSAPILGDLDGDGKAEILVGLGNGQVAAFHGDGSRFTSFPLALSSSIITSGIILNDSVQMSGGNIIYMKRDLFFKTEDGLVYGFSMDVRNRDGQEKTPWLMYGYNAGHTNSVPSDLLPVVPVYADLMPDKSVYNYPNPAKDETTIRYFLSRDAQVDIKIYDLSGDLVAQASQSGKANTENEYKWDCSKYASGVYLCRVEAKSDGGKNVAFCKVALIK